ncbi:substrate-binding periplasmic protein [Thalassotalea sp. PLHSN55]|uniref:substrate-binding periplasmic protein n=1 Tax=Thalassotalea sp. PLHSN55 TaxID=3435888 RepID=UPI003F8494B1
MQHLTNFVYQQLKQTKILLVSCVIASSVFSPNSLASNPKNVNLLTDVWPPYINEDDKAKGSAAKLVELLLNHQKVATNWQYMPYEYAFDQVSSQQANASFPYFKTAQRQAQVLFSQPVFSVTSRVYYNRQFLNASQAEKAFNDKKRIGKVAGYSYGETIDQELTQAHEFASEDQALTALLNNDIDVLPMTEGVMNHQLSTNFPQRKQLIVALKNIADKSSLHVIGAKNTQGETIITMVNTALNYMQQQGMTSLLSTTSDVAAPVDVAKLVSSEGYPLILGQSSASGDNIQYYTLPQGSKVLVIKWSPKILQPSHNDSIYKNMMDLSKVVLLNGPHVGKELYIRNMHIELQ